MRNTCEGGGEGLTHFLATLGISRWDASFYDIKCEAGQKNMPFVKVLTPRD